MKRIADLTTLARADWLALRRQGLGSSDAPAVLGVSPYRTQLEVWAEKVGLAEPEENEAMRWGRLLEPLVAEEYARASGVALLHPQAIYQHPDHPWMLATPDRLATPEAPRIVIEIKTRATWRQDDDIPAHYRVQVQHQLAVLGLERATLVILVAGQRLLWTDVERDDGLIRDLVEQEREFWRRVELRDPPPPVAEDRTRGVLARLYPRDSGATVQLPPEAEAWDEELCRVREELVALERRRAELEARIQAAMGEAAVGVLPSGGRYTWRVVRRELKPQPARVEEHRVFRRL
jgi:putative phage-type endonuclease